MKKICYIRWWPHSKRMHGFSLLELLVSISVIAFVAAIATPVFAHARKSTQIRSSLSKLRQIHTALMLYQMDHQPVAEYGTASEMALPDLTEVLRTRVGLPVEAWRSSCGRSPVVDPKNPLALDFGYSPENSEGFRASALKFRENLLLVADMACDDPNIPRNNPYMRHRGLGVLLSGQLVHRYAEGNPSSPGWWANPSE